MVLAIAGVLYGALFAAEVKLPPGVSQEQVILDEDFDDGTNFDASGLILEGGVSEHFQIPPIFCLLSDFLRDPEGRLGYPDTEALEALELPNAERYPLQIRDLADPSLEGLTVIGQQSRDLPWRVVKAMWDGDAVLLKGCSGSAEISSVYFENVEDGLGPMEGLDRWVLRDAYMRFIRDDAVENDDLVPGEITNCLIDGCFVFLSQRPEPARWSDAVTTIKDCLVHIQPQPHDGVTDGAWRDPNIVMGEDGIGRAPGMIFKWERGAGTVVVKDSIFLVEAMSFNGVEDMHFPPGEYENVTIVWTGEGPYPVGLPRGVAVTTDISVWEKARAAWIRRLSSSHPAYAALNQDDIEKSAN